MCKLKDYVPRHLRLGSVVTEEKVEAFHEQKREIPIIDDNGHVVEVRYEIVKVPAAESMAKYKLSDFRLSAMVSAGVPLKMVNINRSNSFTINELEQICQNLDNSEQFVNKVLQQRAEAQNWFKPVDEQKTDVEQDK